jgi:hypothetical protein
MSSRPVLLPHQILDGTGPGVGYRIEGELVPVLHIALDGRMQILLRTSRGDVETASGRHPVEADENVFRRLLAGMPIFMTEAVGAGDIAFSRDAAGQVFTVNLVRAANLIRAAQAACWYSWRMPPSRSRRWMSRWSSCAGAVIGWGSGRRGAAARRVRWDRCSL